MSTIIIDGVNLPAPSKFRISKTDIDSADTGFNELGVIQKDRIRQGRCSIELDYMGSASSEIQTIESAIEPVKINVTFPSPTGEITKEMFVESRKGPEMIRYVSDSNKIVWRLNLVLTEY